MIHVLGSLDGRKPLFVATSGGPDSMFVVDFLRSGRHEFTVAHFNHGPDGTTHGAEAEEFVKSYCEKNNLKLIVGRCEVLRDPKLSPEEFFRVERYKFLHSIAGTVITAHTLNDVAETWIFSALNGMAKLIPYQNKNVIRPFLLTQKKDILTWNKKKMVPYLTDPLNAELKYNRNRIRHQIIPEALKVNPGLFKLLKRKIQEKYLF